MTRRLIQCMSLLIAALVLSIAVAKAQTSIDSQKQKKGKGTITPQACCPLVQGTGTIGMIPKWVRFTGTNFVLGDSLISESNGNVTVGGSLTVSGSSPMELVQVTNTAPLGTGLSSTGGPGGDGMLANGGASTSGTGGFGVRANGGASSNNFGGGGVFATGGASSSGTGGTGIDAVGGSSHSDDGGVGIITNGGNSDSGFGGKGAFFVGGTGSGAGRAGGTGIEAVGGDGVNGATRGLAGLFSGNVQVNGNLFATGTKMFKIDHPLDPENKYLNHAAIESSEVLNLYSGNVNTDQNGDAIVSLPDWFEALNRDFRYQLTVLGSFAHAIISEKVKGNRFAIKTNAPNVEVSWQVTGVRNDRGMRAHPFKVEEEKAERERGYYLQPDVFDQPEERGVEWARHPDLMQELKRKRVEAEKANRQKTVNQ